MNPDARENFRRQAEWCAQLGSPLTALVCKVLHERLTESSVFGARLLNWPGRPDADFIAGRACAALNFYARGGYPALAPLYPPHSLPSEITNWSPRIRAVVAASWALGSSLRAIVNSAASAGSAAPGAVFTGSFN